MLKTKVYKLFVTSKLETIINFNLYPANLFGGTHCLFKSPRDLSSKEFLFKLI